MKYEVGSLVEVSYRETEDQGSWWEYGVITHVYDDRTCILTESGKLLMRCMEDTEEIPTYSEFVNYDVIADVLYLGGKPVKVKKSLLGKYKFPKS